MLIESFSGIRGIFKKELTTEIIQKYTTAFLTLLKEATPNPRIVLAMDPRSSSPEIKSAVLETLSHCIDIGTLPVAAAQIAVRNLNANGGIMITASHNEPEFNGLKFLSNEGSVLVPEDMKQLIEFAQKIKIKKPNVHVEEAQEAALTAYIAHITTYLDLEAIKTFHRKILVDPNGGCSIHLREIAEHLELECFEFINDTEGNFTRAIEPNETSLAPLAKMIDKQECAAGFDCDADRVELILKNGKIVNGNHLLAIIANDILQKCPGTIVTNDATSQVVKAIAQQHSCQIVEVEVGEINVVEAMKVYQSPIGGEGSNGGIILPPATSRDGITTLLKLIEILAKNNTTLTQEIEKLPAYFTIQTKVENLNPIRLKDKLKNHWKGSTIQETGDLSGGLKIWVDDNTFVWARGSKTEHNITRIIIDSQDEETLSQVLKEVMQLIE